MTAALNTTIPIPSVPVFDIRTGVLDLSWYRFFLTLWTRSGGAIGVEGFPGGFNGNVQYNANGTFGGYSDVQLTTHIVPFTATLSGAVPPSGGGTTNFLRADGTFARPVNLTVNDLTGDTVANATTITFGAVTVTGPSPTAFVNIATITGTAGVAFGATGENVFLQGGDDAPSGGTGAGGAFVIGGNSKSGGGGGSVNFSTGSGDAFGGKPGEAFISMASGVAGNGGQDGGSASIDTGAGASDGGNGGDIDINLGAPGPGGRGGVVNILGAGNILLVGTTAAASQTISAQIVGGALLDVVHVGIAAASPVIISGTGAPAGTPTVATLYIRNNGSVGAGLYFANAGAGYNPVAGV